MSHRSDVLFRFFWLPHSLRLARSCSAQRDSPWEEVRGQVLLGSEQFVERLAPGLQDKRLLTEISRRQRFAARPTLRQLVGTRTRIDRVRRNETIRRAHLEYGYSLSEIGRAVSLHYSTVSRIVNAEAVEHA